MYTHYPIIQYLVLRYNDKTEIEIEINKKKECNTVRV